VESGGEKNQQKCFQRFHEQLKEEFLLFVSIHKRGTFIHNNDGNHVEVKRK